MWKLATFCCAAVVITSALAASLERSDTNSVILTIDQAIKNINARAGEIHQQMSDLGPQPTSVHFDILSEFEESITNNIERARSAVNEILNKPDINNIKIHCNRFLEDLENTAEVLLRYLRETIYFELFDVVAPLSDLFRASSRAQENLNRLKDLAQRCHGNECDEFEKIVNKTSSDFFTNATNAFDDYVRMVNGSRLLHTLNTDVEYNNFLTRQRDVVKLTTSCVNEMIRSDDARLVQ